MSSAFERATAVTVDAEIAGRFHAHIPETWSAPNVPQGGTVLAAATRAMHAALPTPLPLRSVSCVFAAPVAAGDAEIDVAVLRAGRTVAQATATMRTPGADAGLTAIAVFGSTRPGFVFTDVEPPPMPSPETLPSFRDAPPEGVELDGDPFPFWVHHVEGRPVLGHAPWESYVPESSERAAYQHFDEPPVRTDGTIDPLALVALCDTMPAAVSERMGRPLDLAWYGPSADLTVHVLAPARSAWLLARSRARRAGDGYASVELELWDPECGLVAYGTQTMIFRFSDGVPEGDERFPLDRRAAG